MVRAPSVQETATAPDDHFDQLRALYANPDWRVPERVLNVQTQQLEAA